MTNKQHFKNHCQAHPEIPLFLQYDWMEIAVKPEQWDVALVEAGNEIQAFMPYFKKRKLKFDIITVAPLTPYMGPWIHYPEGQKESTRLSYEKKLFDKLLAQLPKTDKFIQYFHPAITNWLPFYWKGFEQSTRYTYIIDDLTDVEKLYEDLQGNIRREISKAKKQLLIIESDEISTLHSLKEKDYSTKGEQLNYSKTYFENIHRKLTEKKCCKTWVAKDKNDKPVASLLLVWDADSAYYLAGAVDPTNRNTGAMSLLMWTAIQFSSGVTNAFNFEGSMVEPIERFFRSFGAKQTPYFEIRKTDSKLLKLL
ncbi:MAG: GNAT family N-acetyltransferase [Flavobacteriales bacterium]|nr:GNAT family N-acetyltransferase [Flavobacteriales bacterium]